MKVLIIINPESGKKQSNIVLEKIVIPKLNINNINYKCSFTKYKLHANKLIQNENLNAINFIIVLGGDGTMHEVINGMLARDDNTNIPIGLLPTGSGNSLLHDRGSTDIETNLEKILKYNISKIDLLKIHTPKQIFYSINLMGWGMVNEIGLLAEKMRWMGPIRYNIASIIKIFQYSPKNIKLEIDGEKYTGEYTFIIACNTIHIGKGMKMAPYAKLDDGKMDLIIIKNNFNKLKLLKIFPKLFSGNHIHDKIVEYKQAKHMKLIPEFNTAINIDGEITGQTPISIEVMPNIIKLLN